MEITYRETKEFDKMDIELLLKDIHWKSIENHMLFMKTIPNYHTVISAWDGNTLVGIIMVMDDGAINVHIQYIIVRTDYQNKGIGTKLLKKVIERYQNFVRISLESVPEKVEFYYKNFGFVKSIDVEMKKYLNKQ